MSVRILIGDARAMVASLPDESVQAVVTSPPYFALRSYLPDGHPDKALEIGQEKTLAEYLEAMVDLFRDIRRVLRKDGTAWINIGDSFAGGGNGGGGSFAKDGIRCAEEGTEKNKAMRYGRRGADGGLKPKDLMMVPARLAIALQDDGWWLRKDIIWHKSRVMPESVKDRPVSSHEHVLMLSKAAHYFYDYMAVRQPLSPSSVTRMSQDIENQAGSARANGGVRADRPMKAPALGGSTLTGTPYGRHHLGEAIPEKERRPKPDKQRGHSRRHAGFNERWDAMTKEEQQAGGANLRDVWTIAPAMFADAHFAVMPERLAETCILAATKEGDTVLDPFMGAATTLLVADRLRRNAIGIELNPEYVGIAEARLRKDGGIFMEIEKVAA